MVLNARGQLKLCDLGVSAQLITSHARTYTGTQAYMAVRGCAMPMHLARNPNSDSSPMHTRLRPHNSRSA